MPFGRSQCGDTEHTTNRSLLGQATMEPSAGNQRNYTQSQGRVGRVNNMSHQPYGMAMCV